MLPDHDRCCSRGVGWSGRLAFQWLAFVVLAIPCGCSDSQDGPRRVHVSGVVKIDGEPLKSGVVRFIPVNNTPGPKVSIPVTDGVYVLTPDEAVLSGPVVGSHRLEVESTDDGGYAMDDESALAELKTSGKKIDRQSVPRAYHGRTSGLTATLTIDGDNVVDILMHSKSR